MTREIALTKGKVALVDDDDFDWLSAFAWKAMKSTRKHHPDTWYAARSTTLSHPRRWMCRYMHKEILGLAAGAKGAHINGNTLDNRRANLRPASESQNQANRINRNPVTSSRFRGVTRHRQLNKWQAMICLDNERRYLGVFDDEEEAARAYDRKARELFGDFARPNFPEGER